MIAAMYQPTSAGFRLIFFDCDSTLTAIEGIDELARLKGQYDHIAALTRRAMLSGYIARVYSHAANGLRTVSPAGAPAILCLGSPAPPLWFVTFANDTQQVSITVPECGYSTNGFLDGPGGFLNDLQPLTTAAPVAVTKSEGGVDGLR